MDSGESTGDNVVTSMRPPKSYPEVIMPDLDLRPPNLRLRQARERLLSPSGSGRPMSRRELADAVSQHLPHAVDDKYIGKLERGLYRWPSKSHRTAFRQVLGVQSDHQLGFYIDRPLRRSASTADDGRPFETDSRGDRGEAHACGVTDLWPSPLAVTGFGVAGTAEAHESDVDDRLQRVMVALNDARRYLDDSVVGILRQELDRCKVLDGARGPAATLPIVLGVLRAISPGIREVQPRIRDSLLSLAAEGAEFTGWLYRDLRQLEAATYWYDRAMEWAQEATNAPMQGYVLIKKSQMAYDAGDAHRVGTLADAAVNGPWRLTDRVRSEAVLQSALGMAMTGAPMVRVERAVDDARQLLEVAVSADRPGWEGNSSFTADTLILREATCYTEAGMPARAASLYDAVLSGDRLSRRDAGFFRARRAVALAAGGEPDEAAAVGLEALQLAAATNSVRTRRVVRDVVRMLRPWDGRPGSRQLQEALSLTS